jgi:hypothetical protein
VIGSSDEYLLFKFSSDQSRRLGSNINELDFDTAETEAEADASVIDEYEDDKSFAFIICGRYIAKQNKVYSNSNIAIQLTLISLLHSKVVI